MQNGAVLIDLSPFSKFDISGPDALSALQRMCTANVDVATGTAVYTQMLNRNGGIEADLTVTRHGASVFRVTSGAATRWKDLAWFRRHAGTFRVEIRDRTENEAVIGVMGAQARALLASQSDEAWDDFAFATARPMKIAGVGVLATRLSFVGELGWEVSTPVDVAPKVFDALHAAGARPMGHYAVDGCRLEKGFKHWGHDLGPEITPIEARLQFCIDWNKPDFMGREALLAQKATGASRRLVLFEVSGSPLMLHDEPVNENGKVIGLTTSGAKGPRTGKTLAFALVSVTPDETMAQTAERQFEVEVAGTRYAATALTRAPFDADGVRMRA